MGRAAAPDGPATPPDISIARLLAGRFSREGDTGAAAARAGRR